MVPSNMRRACQRVRSSPHHAYKRKEGPTDPHERTAILLAETLRPGGKLFHLPSPAKGFRLHNRPHGEGGALSAGTPRRLREAKQFPSGARKDRELARVPRGGQGTARRDFQVGGVQALRAANFGEFSFHALG